MASFPIREYGNRIIYQEGVHHHMVRTPSRSTWLRCIEQNPSAEMGTRILTRRYFYSHQNQQMCAEYILTRVSYLEALSGWSMDTVVFLEGTRSPFPYHLHQARLAIPVVPEGELDPLTQSSSLLIHSESEINRRYYESIEARHDSQNRLSEWERS